MKQILNINLGGYPVTIDTDAYEHLSRYLDAIEQHFKESDAAEEILSDIEGRMAELFKENIHPRTIVTMPDVKAAIDIMGTPEMFGAEAMDEEEPTESGQKKKKKKSSSGFNPGKRLFRDPDDKLLGGVSSGLAAFLGVADPIWIRILFIVFTLAGFASVPIYLILWIVMPVAKTSSDRLAMRGEPINVESIASSVVEELEHFSEKINDQFGSSKKKNGGKSRMNFKWIAPLGSLLSAIILGVSHAARPILKILGGLLIVVLIFFWISLVISAIAGITKASFFLPSDTIAFGIGMVGLFFVVGAPIMGLILTILRVFFKRENSVGLRWTLVGLWIFGLFGLSFSAAKISNSYDKQASYKQIIPVNIPKDVPLEIKYEKVFLANNDARNLSINGMVKFDWKNIKLNIQPSHDGSYRLVQVQEARGSDVEDAEMGAKKFEYQPVFEGNILQIPSDYFIPKGERFRVQEVELTLYVPVGQKVILDKRLRKLDLNISKESVQFGNLYGEELKMGDGGLVSKNTLSSTTPTVKGKTQVLALDDFSSIDVEGPLELNVQQGDSFRVKIRGAQDGDPIDMMVVDGVLKIELSNDFKEEVEVFITMPSLDRLTAKWTKDILISKFSGSQLEINLDGTMEVKLEADVEKLVTNLSNKAQLEVIGNTELLEAQLSNKTSIDGTGLKVEKADVKVIDDASVEIEIDGHLEQYEKKH